MAAKSRTRASRADSLGTRIRDAMTPGRVVLLVVAVLVLVFIVENTRHVKIRLIGPEVSMPLWMGLVGMLVIGWLLGRFVFVRRR